MKRILPVLLALAILLTLPVYAAGGKLTATAAKSGDKVTVTVHLDNPGIIATRIFVRYDSGALQLTSAENGDVFPQSNATFGNDLSNNPYTMIWDQSTRRDNNTTSGTLCTLTFAVKGGTADGKTNVKIGVDHASTLDVDLNEVTIAEASCSVSVPVSGAKDTTTTTTAAAKPASAAATSTAAAKPASSAAATTAAAAKPASAASPNTTAKTTVGTTAATKAANGASTTKAAAQPQVTTTKASAATKAGQTTVPQKQSVPASSAAASTAAAAAAQNTTAAVGKPETAETAATVPNEPASDAASAETAPNGITPEETVPEAVADGELTTIPETLPEPIIDPAPPTNHRGLLWLLVLIIPAAAAVILIIRKKKA